jgi:hypothetical protein
VAQQAQVAQVALALQVQAHLVRVALASALVQASGHLAQVAPQAALRVELQVSPVRVEAQVQVVAAV